MIVNKRKLYRLADIEVWERRQAANAGKAG